MVLKGLGVLIYPGNFGVLTMLMRDVEPIQVSTNTEYELFDKIEWFMHNEEKLK